MSLRLTECLSAEIVVFSDSLDVKRCLELKKASDKAGIGCSFGVGTDLTNGARSCFTVLELELTLLLLRQTSAMSSNLSSRSTLETGQSGQRVRRARRCVPFHVLAREKAAKPPPYAPSAQHGHQGAFALLC